MTKLNTKYKKGLLISYILKKTISITIKLTWYKKNKLKTKSCHNRCWSVKSAKSKKLKLKICSPKPPLVYSDEQLYPSIKAKSESVD